jgi:hypothetical protein
MTADKRFTDWRCAFKAVLLITVYCFALGLADALDQLQITF